MRQFFGIAVIILAFITTAPASWAGSGNYNVRKVEFQPSFEFNDLKKQGNPVERTVKKPAPPVSTEKPVPVKKRPVKGVEKTKKRKKGQSRHEQSFFDDLEKELAEKPVKTALAEPEDTEGEDDDLASQPRPESGNLAELAMSYIGTPYVYGGSTPEEGFDCSGFISYLLKKVGKSVLPHNAREMAGMGKEVELNELREGDLVFFNTLGAEFSHVGVYIGNDKFVHANRSSGSVRVATLSSQYFMERFNGARRI